MAGIFSYVCEFLELKYLWVYVVSTDPEWAEHSPCETRIQNKASYCVYSAISPRIATQSHKILSYKSINLKFEPWIIFIICN